MGLFTKGITEDICLPGKKITKVETVKVPLSHFSLPKNLAANCSPRCTSLLLLQPGFKHLKLKHCPALPQAVTILPHKSLWSGSLVMLISLSLGGHVVLPCVEERKQALDLCMCHTLNPLASFTSFL